MGGATLLTSMIQPAPGQDNSSEPDDSDAIVPSGEDAGSSAWTHGSVIFVIILALLAMGYFRGRRKRQRGGLFAEEDCEMMITGGSGASRTANNYQAPNGAD